MKRIAVLTSGGDAPGMNAAIRAVVRTGLAKGWDMLGVRHGYAGLISGDIIPLGARDVGGIIQRGGTILGSARCLEFQTEEGRLTALSQLRKHEIEALVVIGGNGSQTGAHALSQLGFPVVGVASTIDNDLYGSDITASSHHRAFLVEVMGHKCGYLALMAAIAGGAEAVIIPEEETDPEAVATDLRAAFDNGKAHAIVVVAEGARYNAEGMAQHFKAHQERLGFELRVTRLGHVQRGGAPGSFDRLLGTNLGAAATDQLTIGEHGVMVGLLKGEIAATPLPEVVANRKSLDLRPLRLARILAK
jgi:6-phosphofructokinase 1